MAKKRGRPKKKQPERKSIRDPADVEIDSRRPAKDMRMIERAVRNGWPISSRLKRKIVNKMEDIIDTTEEERNAVAASRVVIAADNVNTRREAIDANREKSDTNVNVQVNVNHQADGGGSRLLAIAERLGFAGLLDPPTPGVIEASFETVGLSEQDG